jgi:hypothetical protein
MRLATLTLLLLAAPVGAADPTPRSRAKAALALASSCDCPKEAPPKCGRAAEVLLAVIAQIDAEAKSVPTAPAPRAKAGPKVLPPGQDNSGKRFTNDKGPTPRSPYCGCDPAGCQCDGCGCGLKAAAPVSPEARKVPAPMPAPVVGARFTDALTGCVYEAQRQPDGSVAYVRVSCPQRR